MVKSCENVRRQNARAGAALSVMALMSVRLPARLFCFFVFFCPFLLYLECVYVVFVLLAYLINIDVYIYLLIKRISAKSSCILLAFALSFCCK